MWDEKDAEDLSEDRFLELMRAVYDRYYSDGEGKYPVWRGWLHKWEDFKCNSN